MDDFALGALLLMILLLVAVTSCAVGQGPNCVWLTGKDEKVQIVKVGDNLTVDAGTYKVTRGSCNG